jgi:hypothetical protein
MALQSINIPAQPYPVGRHAFVIDTPPAQAGGGQITVTNDLWLAGSIVDIHVFMSYDGGLTWPDGVTSRITELTRQKGGAALGRCSVSFKKVAGPTPDQTITVIPTNIRVSVEVLTQPVTSAVTAGWV